MIILGKVKKNCTCAAFKSFQMKKQCKLQHSVTSIDTRDFFTQKMIFFFMMTNVNEKCRQGMWFASSAFPHFDQVSFKPLESYMLGHLAISFHNFIVAILLTKGYLMYSWLD